MTPCRKGDRVAEQQQLGPVLAELLRETTGREVLLVSAVTGRGLPELNRQIIQRLAELKAADAMVATDVGAATAPAVSEPPLERPE